MPIDGVLFSLESDRMKISVKLDKLFGGARFIVMNIGISISSQGDDRTTV